VTGLFWAAVAASGTYLLYTSVAFGWRGLMPRRLSGERALTSRPGVLRRLADWMAQAGLADVPAREVVGAIAGSSVAFGLVGLVAFGAVTPALVLAICGAAWPIGAWRRRRLALRAAAQEAWPHLIEEIRMLTSAVGRSVPQALFEAGERAPAPLRPAFEAAHREWVLSTDFERTVAILKARLADPTADAACETLLVAHEVGGADLDRRLDALAKDRRVDVQGRKDGLAKQAGVRFARRFVLLVPCGMALAGMSIGTGRAAYQTSFGQVLVVLGILTVGACWAWSGVLLRLPAEQRVFE
jgi:tight adherence protein B